MEGEEKGREGEGGKGGRRRGKEGEKREEEMGSERRRKGIISNLGRPS